VTVAIASCVKATWSLASWATPVGAAFRSGRSGTVDVAGRTFFLNVHLPQPRLVIIGAVHISQALAPMAKIAGFPAEIIDPRTAFATPERFEGVSTSSRMARRCCSSSGRWTAIRLLAAVTHDPKIDDFALKAALDANCFYIGALGSRKTHARRVERLLAMGASQAQIDTILAPIGLDIGAASPAEIAVAVLAQVIETFHARGLGRSNGSAG
jgi:xanthine dehydrogenase accessory factor